MKRLIGLLVAAALAGCGGDPAADTTDAVGGMCVERPVCPGTAPGSIEAVSWCPYNQPGAAHPSIPTVKKCGLWCGLCVTSHETNPDGNPADCRAAIPTADAGVFCVASCDECY